MKQEVRSEEGRSAGRLRAYGGCSHSGKRNRNNECKNSKMEQRQQLKQLHAFSNAGKFCCVHSGDDIMLRFCDLDWTLTSEDPDHAVTDDLASLRKYYMLKVLQCRLAQQFHDVQMLPST